MGGYKIKSFNPEAAQLENILIATENLTFCKREASAIVGGNLRLERLVAAGEIRAEKRAKAQNGKWWCNAADVLRHCRNMRKKQK